MCVMEITLLLVLLFSVVPSCRSEEHQHDNDSHASTAPDKLNAKLKFTTHDIHHIKEHLKEDFGINEEKANKYLSGISSFIIFRWPIICQMQMRISQK